MGFHEKKDEAESKSLLQTIKYEIDQWYNYFSENILLGRQDYYFLFYDQWLAEDKQDLLRFGKPLMTFNKLYDYYKKTVAQYRQNTPSINVRCKDFYNINNPNDLQRLQFEVSLREGLFRSIEYDSKADIAYQTSFENALSRGYGAIMIDTEYEDNKTFNQCVRIKEIPISEQAFFDPTAVTPTKYDGDYCGMYYAMNRKAFEKEYPYVPYPVSFSSWGTIAGNIPWMQKDQVVIAKTWRKEYFKNKLYYLDNNESMDKKEYDLLRKNYQDGVKEGVINFRMPEIIDEREFEDYHIYVYKIIGNKILERKKWNGKLLPMVFQDGDSFYYEGRQKTQTFIKHAKDAQRLYNFICVEHAQAVRTGRKEQYIATPGNISGFEQYWKNPEVQLGALLANPDPLTRAMPIVVPPSQVAQSLIPSAQKAAQDMQEILGIYEANLGAPSNEKSGVAINNRVRQGDLAYYVYRDNAIRAQEQVARIILDLIPVIYDTERTITLIKPDKSQQNIMVNRQTMMGIQNDLTNGNFDVEVKSVPPYEVQKQQNLEFLLTLAQDPQIKPLIADLIADNIDVENRDQLKARLQTLVPAAIIAKENGKPPPPVQPNPMAQLQQAEMAFKARQLTLKQSEIMSKYDIENKKYLLELAKLQKEMQELPFQYRADIEKSIAEIKKAQYDHATAALNALNRNSSQKQFESPLNFN